MAQSFESIKLEQRIVRKQERIQEHKRKFEERQVHQFLALFDHPFTIRGDQQMDNAIKLLDKLLKSEYCVNLLLKDSFFNGAYIRHGGNSGDRTIKEYKNSTWLDSFIAYIWNPKFH